MAIRSSFFNSVNGDRRYLAYNFAEYFASFIGNGVFANPSNAFQVYEKENMIVNVKAGKAWINGYIAVNDGDYNLTITNADGVLNRIDRIVLRLDFNVRAINVAVKKGAFASTPVAPNLQRDAEVYELVLADVYVGKGITRITQSNITDQRMNKALCGVVKGTVDQIDTTDLFNQYGSAFQEWFETVKNYLNDTAVGNVANKLAEHELNKGAHGLGIADLNTTAKTIREAINEVFQNGNNVKENVVATLLSLDSTLPITNNSAWANIISALPNISGKSAMNVYIQTTEPTKKEGIWFNTDNPLDTEDYKLSNNGVNINLTLDTSRMQMPFKSTAFASVYYNDAIYVLVGNVYKYDIKNNVWGVVSTAPSPGANSNDAVLYGDDIYVQIGTTDFYKYNISKNTWTKLADLPFTQPATYTLVNGYIYTIGGSYYSTYYSYVYKYNIATNTWTKLKDMAETSNQHKAVALGTNIYVGPLVTSYDSNFNKYDTLTDTWTKVANMPLNLRAFGILAIGTCVYIFGGIINSWGTASNTIYKYDTITGTWSGVGSMYSTYWGLNAIYNNDILFLMGGYDTSRSDYVGLNHSYSVKFTDLIKGVTIDQSYFKYATQFLNAKGYTSLGRITSQFKLAYLSVDGKIPKFNVPTYYGNGSNWVKTDIN